MYTKKISWDVADVIRQLNSLAHAIKNPYNDGFTASGFKQDLFRIKCIIEDLYESCPQFVGEEIWEQERVIDLLKKE